MIWMWLVEIGVLDQQYFFFLKQFGNEGLIVFDWVNFWVKFWEYVECCFGFDVIDVGNGIDQFIGDILLVVYFVFFGNQIVDVLIVVECCLYVVLFWCIGVQVY